MNRKEYCEDLRGMAIKNTHFYRKVLATYSKKMQLVIYKLKNGESLEREEHMNSVQFIYVEEGSGMAVVGPNAGKKKKSDDDKTYELSPGVCLIIPKKTYHYIHNDGERDLKMFSIYVPGEFEPNREDINM